MFMHDCLNINENGHLTIGGLDTVDLANKYGTPAYIMDEQTIRGNCRVYKEAIEKYYGNGSMALYASKALCFKGLYKIIAEEGLGIDVVSSGELYTAKKANFPMEKIYFHGNNKTDLDIQMALDYDIGCFVADNYEELDAINNYAKIKNKVPKILLRITPGIDTHTHKAINTGNVSSKFGTAIITGQAMEIVKYALSLENIDFAGLHCHIGSQIFECDPFFDAASIMIKFMSDIKIETNFEVRELNLGGGFGVRYIDEHYNINYADNIRDISIVVKELCEKYNLNQPRVMVEPGRSLVAASGITLYSVGSVKEITGYKNYVSIDGGMPDNPRYALYQSPYEVIIANSATKPKTYECTIAGRCCESGDLVAENIKIQNTKRGDILAVLVTGAYNYSMASNYNRLPRPPIVMIKDGSSYIAVQRESFDDLISNDK